MNPFASLIREVLYCNPASLFQNEPQKMKKTSGDLRLAGVARFVRASGPNWFLNKTAGTARSSSCSTHSRGEWTGLRETIGRVLRPKISLMNRCMASPHVGNGVAGRETLALNSG